MKKRVMDLWFAHRSGEIDAFDWFTDYVTMLDDLSELGVKTQETREDLKDLWERFNQFNDFIKLPRRKYYRIRNLGEIATKIRAIELDYMEKYQTISDEIDAFSAPSECYALATRGMEDEQEEERQRVFKRYRVNEELYKSELKQRVDGKWRYNHQI